LAVERGQLEDNPFRYVRIPKAAQRAIHTFSDEECAPKVKVARQSQIGSPFRYQFRTIMAKAGIEKGEFHDFRRTSLTNWLANGLSEHDVMTMAGHASFETIRRFYLAVRSDLLDSARKASSAAIKSIFVAKWLILVITELTMLGELAMKLEITPKEHDYCALCCAADGLG